MASTLGITVYYIFFVGESIKSPFDLPQIPELHEIPAFFSIVIFAMACIGVVSSSLSLMLYLHTIILRFHR